jgi:hypothetical protein
MPFPEDEKSRKNSKKVLDNWEEEWYSNKAVRQDG